jgi:SAM-dependent methyltransferase
MSDYYQLQFEAYHDRTFSLDPSSFLNFLTIHLQTGSTVIDVGCGSGRDILWLKQRGYDVIGLERSRGLVQLAREHTACRIIEADFETFNFNNLSADAVLLIGALVHLPHPKLPDVFESICLAVRKSGYLLITLKRGQGTVTDSDGRRFYLWQDEDLRRVFHALDLSIIDRFVQPSLINAEDTWLGYLLKKQ